MTTARTNSSSLPLTPSWRVGDRVTAVYPIRRKWRKNGGARGDLIVVGAISGAGARDGTTSSAVFDSDGFPASRAGGLASDRALA